MKRSAIAGLIEGLLLVVLAAIVRSCSMPVAPGPVFRNVPAYVTPQGRGVVFMKGFIAHTYATPQAIPTGHPYYASGANFPLGLECKQSLSQLWATEPITCSGDTCAVSNIDWSDFDDCLAEAASQTIMIEPGVTISRPVSLMLPGSWNQGPVGGSGTSGDPYNAEYVPTWLESDFLWKLVYTDGTTYYNSYRYDSDTAQDRLVQMISEAGAKWNANDQVALIRINAGISEEWIPIGCNTAHSGCTTAILTQQEAVVTCAEYRAFIARLTDAALAAFPNKPVVVAGAPGMCGNSLYNKGYEARSKWYTDDDGTNPAYWASTPTPMGLSLNSLEPDALDADEWGQGVLAGWGILVAADKAIAAGAPFVGEYRFIPSASKNYQASYWTALAGAELGADFLVRVSQWNGIDAWDYWDVIWERIGEQDTLAWITFRDAEWPGFTWTGGGYSYGSTGQRGDFDAHVALLTPTAYPQYCDTDTINAAATAVANPLYASHTVTYLPCGLPRTPGPTPYKLPTPKYTPAASPSPEATSQFYLSQLLRDRQARKLPAGETMAIAAEAGWAYFGSTVDVDLSLDYLDIGTTPISLQIATGASTYETRSIARSNTGLWQRAELTVASTVVTNTLAVAGRGNAYVTLSSEADLFVGDLAIDVTDSGTPTATPTPTATAVATDTPTLTPTLTPTPTGTPVFTATPSPATLLLSELCLEPTTDLNLDGAVDADDRAIEMVNWTAAELDLAGYYLTFDASCAIADATLTYAMSEYASIDAYKHKVLYGRDLRDLLGDKLTLPNTGDFRLCAPGGTQLDAVTTAGLSATCTQRSGASWVDAVIPDLGR